MMELCKNKSLQLYELSYRHTCESGVPVDDIGHSVSSGENMQHVLTPNSSHIGAWSRPLRIVFDAQGSLLGSLFDMQGPLLFSVVCLDLMVCMHL